MRLTLKYKRSDGVAVSAAVHRLIARGNAARQRRDWAGAALAYRQALAADPSLAHIWVQLGHCVKEQGLTAQAESAYLRAAELQPDHPDPQLQLGHLASQAQNHASAGRHYLRAFQADPGLIEGASALHRVLAHAKGRTREQLIQVLKATLDDEPGPETTDRAVPSNGAEGASLAFDASDLVGYFAHSRLPTGIQRVQIQAISNALLRPDRTVHICCFIEGRDDWLEIPVPVFRALIELSAKGGSRNDPEWIKALHRLHLRLTLAPPFAFPNGAYLINLGSSWQLYNYFLFVRAAKAKYGIRYIPFIHDLIPIVAPEHFTKALTREFVAWVIGIFAHADHFLVNSQATRRDLMQAAAQLGLTLDAGDVAVIPLNADFRTHDAAPLPDTALATWKLGQEPFVLLVSTVESRKGHLVAFDAWQTLIARHGAEKIPKLVCVGRNGWLNDKIYQRLEQNERLAARVAMLSGVSDTELALLYRTCLFTIYPSLYEGWGLPVTEALCYGKPVIASNTSSLPEAGGPFATYVKAGSAPELAASVQRMVFDAEYRDGIVAKVATGFQPRSWTEVARQIELELIQLSSRAAGRASTPRRPIAQFGSYYPIGRGMALRIWLGLGSGEAFRAGIGWHSPGLDGCWTRQQGGELAIGLHTGHRALRVAVLLLGAPDHDMDWRLRVRQGPTLGGTLRQGSRKWITFNYPPAEDGGVLRLHLQGESTEADVDAIEEERASVGLAGFFVHEQDDATAALRLLEAIAMGNLDDIDAYREEISQPDNDADGWDTLTPTPTAPSTPPD